MGTKRSYICPSCGYKVITSGGRDRGFQVWINTFLCLSCFTIQDLRVKGSRNFTTADIIDNQQCDECNGEAFGPYDCSKMRCPKCGTKLEFDPNGWIVNWD